MHIHTLVENTARDERFVANHGLSFHIQTKKHNILFDVGENENFLLNAKQLGIDIAQVDTVIISHAHRDHGGALPIFLEKNTTANIYLQKQALEKYYAVVGSHTFDLSLDSTLKNNPRVHLVDDFLRIDDELSIFSNIAGTTLRSDLNLCLFKECGCGLTHDDFEHEQCLVVASNDKNVLFGGCAHNGIINILEKGEELYKLEFDALFSGFHLFDPITRTSESKDFIAAIEAELRKRKTVYYTGHCTGVEVYETLKKNMPDTIYYAAAGSEVHI